LHGVDPHGGGRGGARRAPRLPRRAAPAEDPLVSRPLLLTATVVFVVAFGAHARSLSGGFVYDDHRVVELNPALSPIDPAAYFEDPRTSSAGMGYRGEGEGIVPDVYRPLSTLNFAVDRAAFGLRPAPYHAESVLAHAVNAVLVLLVLLPLLGGSVVAAAAGALVFALHPATVETVAYVSSRATTYATTAMLAALLVTTRSGAGRTAALGALTAVGCLVKESAVVLPALLLLRDLALPRGAGPSRRETALRVGVSALAVALYFAARSQVLEDLRQVEHPGGSVAASARGMLSALGWYADSLLLPSGFPFEPQIAVPLSWSDPEVVLGLGILLSAAIAGAWALATGRGALAFALLGALACLVPVSNVLVPLKTFAAERFLYPLMPCVAAGVGALLLAFSGRARRPAAAALAAAVVALGAITWDRTAAWADEAGLWEAVLRDRPTSPQAYQGLAVEYQRRGRLRDSAIAYETYLGFNPYDGKAWALLGDLYGSNADALRITKPKPNQTTDVARVRHEWRGRQIQAYREALSAWEHVGDAAGRGSAAWRRAVLERMVYAAWDLGDLRIAKGANDALLATDGVDPARPDEVFGKGAYDRRKTRLLLAFLAVTTKVGGLVGTEYDLRMAARAAVLLDLGLEPSRPDEELRSALVPLFDALARERPGDWKRDLAKVELLEAAGDAAGALALLEELERRFPDELEIRARLRELRRR
jgi:tetratricopeptide (TPR) repeat protein